MYKPNIYPGKGGISMGPINYYAEPHVLIKDFNGVRACSLADKLFMDRVILLEGEVTEELASSVCRQINVLAGQSDDPIILRITSPGGNLMAGMEIIDSIRLSKAPVYTVAVGSVASMGSLIFACGAKRIAYPSSQILIHDPLVMNVGGNALRIQDISEHLMKTRGEMADMLAACTGRTKEEILEATKIEKTFTAEEAVEFGLATEIADRLY